MSSSLAAGIKRFCKHSRRLQTILEETKRCFDDINEHGHNENGQTLLSVEILQEEEEEVLAAAHKYPGIVILGQNAYCKSRVVNEIFNRTIFPSFDNSDDKKRYRMVRFKHGDNLCINLELPGDYALAENLEAYNGPWNTIPHKDLHISDSEAADSATGTAVLEVSFNHQLLRHGCTLVVSACNANFEEGIKQCIEKMSPVLVYAFQSDSFSTQEIQELELLKEITHFQPVCFVRVPGPGLRSPEHRSAQMVAGNPFSCGVIDSSPVSSSLPPHLPTSPSPQCNQAGQQDPTRSNASAKTDDSKVTDENSNSTIDALQKQDVHDLDASSQTRARKESGTASHGLLSESPAHNRMGKVIVSPIPPVHCHTIFKQLCKIGYLTDTPGVRNISREIVRDYFEVDSVLVPNFDKFIGTFTTFCEQTMQRYLVNAVTVLNNTHIRCLNTFIICAFDMAREMLITPKKLEFAREKEEELYRSLLQIAGDQGDEIREMIEKTIVSCWDTLVNKASEYDFIGVDFSESGEIMTYKGLKICTGQIQELVLGGLNQAVAGKLVSSVDILRDSYTGTLTRCLESLEKVEQENPDNNSTTDALKQILKVAYQVEINVRASSTFIHFLLEKMKQLVLTAYRLELSLDVASGYTFRRKMKKLVQAMPWSQSPKIDDEWKKKIASEMLQNLSAARLAKSISSQIKDRLTKSHEAFRSSLGQLEQKHGGRLDKIEEDRLKLRKVYAPRVAKVALESTSLKDLILHGMPQYSKEIGRGQYGVVYACDQWATYSPCAVKSVVPPDDKHWNDLALEFFYTKNIPFHDRIVCLRGSVIDYTYGGGSTPAVLLVMDRMQRDLYTAIKQHLDWVSRLHVSIDVVEGIRFLHSQGLVHRDIKLKNVLLDKDNRAKITDLGFCKPEAMMSGSIVGTPIHMAPELFTGRYDNSVDVYAFGILFWYICAGKVRLPQAFEQCANKDQLWTNVKKGLRPEMLPEFDDECWNLMSECWVSDPIKRPLLGEVQQRITRIYERYKNRPGGPTRTAKDPPSSAASKSGGHAMKYKLKQ